MNLVSPKKALFIFAHPNSHSSRANRKIAETVANIPNLTFHSLYEEYPEFYIDVKREKELLLAHDLIVFQHPLYWYSMPPLLKLWMDLVLEFNFAYGPKGHALKGKQFLLSITAGGPQSSYSAEGHNKFEIESFFPMMIQSVRLCGMEWKKPEVLFHSRSVSDVDLMRHSESVRDKILSIVMGDQ